MYNPLDHYWLREDGVIFSSLRSGTVGVNDEAYAAWLKNGGTITVWPRDANGEQTDDALQEVLSPHGVFMASITGLAALQTAMKAVVDARAESERLKYITPGQGQALTYQRKSEEARRAALEDNPRADDFPLLAASLGIEGDSIAQIAELVLTQDAAWASVGSAIERDRLMAKRAIDAATTPTKIQVIIDALKW
ncbi:hypothetical protein [Agrobacterium pusense]|uniref:hypothetical protein n=1 Tax=Agrobacterium pusense TaxID=648995 RepID=UPI00088179D7|nr:hypothetical protein [Agrobacterium pusense]OOO15664.1 hypothetical protein BTE56_24280 [Agrobacterium pusense]WKD47136.1 hypothetical protein M8C82_13935 [Agrobacterium pusense]SDF16335.1 hypothetical protein SAMN05421750_1089 [Agrobacterium pusense]